MLNDSLVAINIYDQNTNILYNKSLVPILFYWNGNGDLLEDILRNENFKTNYLDNFKDYESYNNAVISYFFFEFDKDDKEAYIENSILISDYVKLKDFNSIQIIYKLLIPHLYNLYKMALKKDYDDTKVFNEEIIIDIYKQIKEKYKDKIEKQTLVNWVRSELINTNKIDSNNVNYIIKQLNNILEHEN